MSALAEQLKKHFPELNKLEENIETAISAFDSDEEIVDPEYSVEIVDPEYTVQNENQVEDEYMTENTDEETALEFVRQIPDEMNIKEYFTALCASVKKVNQDRVRNHMVEMLAKTFANLELAEQTDAVTLFSENAILRDMVITLLKITGIAPENSDDKTEIMVLGKKMFLDPRISIFDLKRATTAAHAEISSMLTDKTKIKELTDKSTLQENAMKALQASVSEKELEIAALKKQISKPTHTVVATTNNYCLKWTSKVKDKEGNVKFVDTYLGMINMDTAKQRPDKTWPLNCYVSTRDQSEIAYFNRETVEAISQQIKINAPKLREKIGVAFHPNNIKTMQILNLAFVA